MAQSSRQLDLLDWTPAAATVRFDDATVRAGTIDGQISRAVGATLRDSKMARGDIARMMGEFLGEAVSVNMLNAYASQAREDHAISLPRFIALLIATHDRRLLQMVAEQAGWAVVERKHLPMIELAAVQEKMAELDRRRLALRHEARRRGGL